MTPSNKIRPQPHRPYDAHPGRTSIETIKSFINHLRILISDKMITKINSRNKNLIITLLFFQFLTPIFFIFFSNEMDLNVYAAEPPANITLKVTQGDSFDIVSGNCDRSKSDNVRVVIFARTNQWYIQPYADERAYLAVNADGTFATWIRDWHQISAFVIRKEYNTLSEQQVYKPFPLSVDYIDILAMTAYPSIHFSGYKWAIKAGDSLGPDSNDFSSNHENVWVDSEGSLHLR